MINWSWFWKSLLRLNKNRVNMFPICSCLCKALLLKALFKIVQTSRDGHNLFILLLHPNLNCLHKSS